MLKKGGITEHMAPCETDFTPLCRKQHLLMEMTKNGNMNESTLLTGFINSVF